ncbi:unnamed protein product [Orchesella dallaii]|uniref:Uncharacterized protein n=1 Tax=Orchesella dallaii TaxID=48710 RepID=A0ABP1R2L5_9HEXA
MDLTKVVKTSCLEVAQFRELLIQIGKNKQDCKAWEIVRIQRKQTLDNCYQVCSILIAKKPTYSVTDINKQLDNLHSCVDWLLDEITKCQNLMLILHSEGRNSEYLSNELLLISNDVDEAKKLQAEIEFHKIKSKCTKPSTKIGIDLTKNIPSLTMTRSEKRKRPMCRPQTRISFP